MFDLDSLPTEAGDAFADRTSPVVIIALAICGFSATLVLVGTDPYRQTIDCIIEAVKFDALRLVIRLIIIIIKQSVEETTPTTFQVPSVIHLDHTVPFP